MSHSNYLYKENETALNRSWNPFIVQGSISGQHNYLTSTLQKATNFTTPSINTENSYRTSNQLDSTQRLRRASIPLRLSSFLLENLTATTITLTLAYTKILLSSKLYMSMSPGQEQGGSAVHRILPPTFYQTTLSKSKNLRNIVNQKKCEESKHSIKKANIIKKKANIIKKKANIFIERPTYYSRINRCLISNTFIVYDIVIPYGAENKLFYFIYLFTIPSLTGRYGNPICRPARHAT